MAIGNQIMEEHKKPLKSTNKTSKHHETILIWRFWGIMAKVTIYIATFFSAHLIVQLASQGMN